MVSDDLSAQDWIDFLQDFIHIRKMSAAPAASFSTYAAIGPGPATLRGQPSSAIQEGLSIGDFGSPIVNWRDRKIMFRSISSTKSWIYDAVGDEWSLIAIDALGQLETKLVIKQFYQS